MTELEKDIERKLRIMVESHGGRCLKWVCPGWAGVPDRLVLLPGGRIVFVETKRPTGGVRGALQRKWAQWLTELGFVHRWVLCQDDIAELEAGIVSRALSVRRGYSGHCFRSDGRGAREDL